MAGLKGSKYFDVFLQYGVWLTNKETGGRMDDNLVELLSVIRDKGSLRSAADALGLSWLKPSVICIKSLMRPFTEQQRNFSTI